MMLERCRQYQIYLNPKKCTFCAPFGIMLCHVVCCNGILVDPSKIVIIVDLPSPATIKQLRMTLGHIGYYLKFIRGYIEVTAPMDKLLNKDVKFKWIEQFQEILNVLRMRWLPHPY